MMTRVMLAVVCMLCMVATSQAAECKLISRACVDGPSTKNISGHQVFRECWQFAEQYQCVKQGMQTNCQYLIDQGCAQIGAECMETHPETGACTLYEASYQCKIGQGQTREVMDCGGQVYCADGKCQDTGYPPDSDILAVVTGMEAMREAGTYFDPDSMTVFNGKSNKCSVKLGGLGNCCKKEVAPGGSSNNAVLPAIALKVGAEAVRYVGSNYMFDTLFAADAPEFMKGAASALGFGGGVGDFAPSAFGITVGFGSSSIPVNALWAGPNGMYISFDPTSFAIQIAIMVITEFLQCDQDEMVLALKRGANLCHYIGSYCSKDILGVCIERKKSYCCFNSKLALIINQQGRPQLGKNWGRPKSPSCNGFSVEELQRIDFSKIDFAEFTAEIKAKAVSAGFATSRAGENVPASSDAALQPYKSESQSYYGY